MESIWTETKELPHFSSLEGDVKTDVLIIGGGITGILCAHFLQEKGVDYLLVEGNTICSGVTKNTTAKITSQHGLIFHKLLKQQGQEKTKLYLEANQKAVAKYYELCKDIDCDFEEKTSEVYSLENRRMLELEAESLYKIGYCPKLVETTELPFPTMGAICFSHQGQFHPLKFLSHMAKDLNVVEHTSVKELKEGQAVTDKGTITYEKVIFATHFPIDNKHGMYFLKMYQHRSYVLALENAPHMKGMYVDASGEGLSFRNYKQLLLLGGGSHRTGKKGGNWQELRSFAKEYYPSAQETLCFATQDCMSLDHIPYIGQYAKTMDHCYVATGYNKWGMTSAMVAAMVLTDMIMEKRSPYEEVFNPSRSMFRLQLACNGFEALTNLLTITTKRCPHLGCALKWNNAEHSWDCPCHGSRFAENGKVLDNPANGDMKRTQ